MKTYTEQEVINLLVKERQKAMDIVQNYYDEHQKIYWDKRAAGNDYSFVNKDIMETCRYIKNSISGTNGISEAIGETMEIKIKKELDNNNKII